MPGIDHVRIQIDEAGKGSIWINGHELKSTVGIELRAGAAKLTEVSIDLIASVDLDAFVSENHHKITIIDLDSQIARVAD